LYKRFFVLIIQDKLVSDDLVVENFICNLSACKGACCWEGDWGAPLDEAELPVLEAIYEHVKPFLSPAGIAAIEQQGKYVWYDDMDSYGTTLIDGGACAYLTYSELGIAHCGIEKAWAAGVVDFKKPVSCHLYPIRVEKFESGTEALNYDRWDICSAACELGDKERVPVYKFLKEAIVRRFGEEFYDELDGAAEFMKTSTDD
jgi:hypothetical protein